MGLIKTGLKAFVAVKTADVIHERILARQAEHAASQGHDVPVATVAQGISTPAPGPSPAEDRLALLRQLGELRESGVLTEAEFESQKARILAG